MAEQFRARTGNDVARRWQVLAERRRNHLLDLYRTGRWRRYYSEDQLMAEMRDAVREIRGWDAIGIPAERPRDGRPFAAGLPPPPKADPLG